MWTFTCWSLLYWYFNCNCLNIVYSHIKTVSIVSLNGSNYPTWKIQCQMDSLWAIVDGVETPQEEHDSDKYRKFVGRRDHALILIVLSIEPSLLYLIGYPEDPDVVWQKLANQFQKNTWANKLELWQKLYSLCLKEGESIQKHVKDMTEVFEALPVIGDPVTPCSAFISKPSWFLQHVSNCFRSKPRSIQNGKCHKTPQRRREGGFHGFRKPILFFIENFTQ